MYRFYSQDLSEAEKVIRITGEDVNHIKNVLRLKIGSSITVGDGSSRDYICTISEIGEDHVLADIVDITDSQAELPSEIVLYQGMPKADKLELVIQKSVELGASEIVPVMMKRSVVKLDDKKKAKKLERYNLIAESAAKQSRRGIIPQVTEFLNFNEAIDREVSKGAKLLVPYESAEGMAYTRSVFASLKGAERIAVFIGPEGGFSPEEIEYAKSHGASIITLGNRILRTETAGLMVLSILGYELEQD